ncbi:CD209 antigen-like protein B [Labrus bergylta]|uniref:C-type lectin domain family 4 member M-like n=1 Tax=Labrus bergylta TaxID=56723 RepID=A0A3Q3E102_9LABR|nr:C-type lectin domain family 4 member M-like [Labrus bergylta]
MILNCDNNVDETTNNPGNKGSMSKVRVGSRSFPLYPVVIVSLGLLNTILMLTAVVIGIYCGIFSEVSASDQNAQTLIIEFKTLCEMFADVIQSQEEAKQALQKELRNNEKNKLQMEQNKTLCDRLQRQIESLHVEKATLQSKLSDIQDNCGRCLPGWLLINHTCYFHSISETSALKNWWDSRADCISRGGNLTVINSLEKQLNLHEFLPKGLQQSKHRGAWIGLTYDRTVHRWVWSNEVTLSDQGYWNSGEPNNQEAPDGACVAIVNKKTPTRTWFDTSCDWEKEWLCEMEPN